MKELQELDNSSFQSHISFDEELADDTLNSDKCNTLNETADKTLELLKTIFGTDLKVKLSDRVLEQVAQTLSESCNMSQDPKFVQKMSSIMKMIRDDGKLDLVHTEQLSSIMGIYVNTTISITKS